MPGFGKSGISRINCFRCSQLTPLTEAGLDITTLPQCEMISGLRLAGIRILQRCQPEPHADPAAGENASRQAARACPLPILLHCRPNYYAPSRQFLMCALLARRTSENLRLERGHERYNAWLAEQSGHLVIVSSGDRKILKSF